MNEGIGRVALLYAIGLVLGASMCGAVFGAILALLWHGP